VRVRWDPHPTLIGLPVWKPNLTAVEEAAYDARMWELYAAYAGDLDQEYPMWPYEILTIDHPPHQLVEMAQHRRDWD